LQRHEGAAAVTDRARLEIGVSTSEWLSGYDQARLESYHFVNPCAVNPYGDLAGVANELRLAQKWVGK
jgi:hypothetical protein